jgi:cytochrome c-type biogenesis protein CcmH/NrfF
VVGECVNAIIIFVLWVIPLFVLVVLDRLAWRRVYDYARTNADRRDVSDPRGQAYNDMATVIILRGKVE